MAQESFIICDNLVRIYKIAGHDVVALQGLDMTVAPGELLGVVGVSGSGKTTLMNILGGLDRPTAGRVWVDGRDLLKLSDMALNRYRLASVGFLWQQSARNLLPYLSAQENVEYPMTIAGEFGRKKGQRAQKLLDAVGLLDRAATYPDRLSGGEQQRVAIARALVHNPLLVLADEPTGNLDEDSGRAVLALLDRLTRRAGRNLLMVTHSPEAAARADRTFHLHNGHLLLQGQHAEAAP